LPVEHIEHTLAPGLEEIVPFWQALQIVTPIPAENRPFPQGVHVLFSSYVPGLQAAHAYREDIPL
jgi:hypothetical protein